MTLAERGLYIELMALAWDAEEPGTITLDNAAICRELRIYSATWRRFLRKFPLTFLRVGKNLIQPKLKLQWDKYKEISDKRSAIAKQMHMQVGGSAFAVASASASAPINQKQHSDAYGVNGSPENGDDSPALEMIDRLGMNELKGLQTTLMRSIKDRRLPGPFRRICEARLDQVQQTMNRRFG
jgi:hypothetical protein